MNTPEPFVFEMKLCECGCGQATNIAPQSHTKRGWVKGRPLRFVRGHANRRHPHGWDEEDRGHPTICWIWRGEKAPTGHARQGGRLIYKDMWEKENGRVPQGLELDHLCRQPSCVRPDHLEAVSHAVNIRRGRNAKISQEVADEIRRLVGSHAEIGRQYGLHPTTVFAIRVQRPYRKQAWT